VLFTGKAHAAPASLEKRRSLFPCGNRLSEQGRTRAKAVFPIMPHGCWRMPGIQEAWTFRKGLDLQAFGSCHSYIFLLKAETWRQEEDCCGTRKRRRPYLSFDTPPKGAHQARRIFLPCGLVVQRQGPVRSWPLRGLTLCSLTAVGDRSSGRCPRWLRWCSSGFRGVLESVGRTLRSPEIAQCGGLLAGTRPGWTSHRPSTRP